MQERKIQTMMSLVLKTQFLLNKEVREISIISLIINYVFKSLPEFQFDSEGTKIIE